MTAITLDSGNLVLRDSIIRKGSILIEGPVIRHIGARPKSNSLVINASGCFVSPGFIDTHIHGEPKEILRNEIPRGTTSFIIAISCAPADKTHKEISKIKKAIYTHPFGGSMLGVRLEGPYISKEKSGAQDKRYIKNPNPAALTALINRLKPILKIMTVAPEIKGARRIIGELVDSGVIASAGHSNADFNTAAAGINAGISHATHIFNAMSGVKDGLRGVAGAVLEDKRVWAEVILDLVHVDRALCALLLKAKGPDRTVFITDSVMAGKPKLAKKRGGAYRFKNGHLAGSAISMIDAVKNSVERCGLSVPEAVRMASYNPAKLLGLEHRKGAIASGNDADLVIFDKNFNVKMVMIDGRIAYKR